MTHHGFRITQQELQELFELKKEIEQKQKRADELTASIKALLIAKVPIEEGRFAAWLSTKTFHHPAWKQAVIEHLGLDFAKTFYKSSRTTIFSEVFVEEHAVPPLWRGATGDSESAV